MGKIISIANQKGGVGKTTTTINLGACLAELGKKVLLIDFDPQGNLTTGIGIEDNLVVTHDMYQVIINEVPMKEVVIPTATPNLFVAPAGIELAFAEIRLSQMIAREMRLKVMIKEVQDEYDFILIDCPPTLGVLTINAFTASNSILIPVQTEFYAMEGLKQLFDTIEIVRDYSNPDLRLEGVLLTMHDKRTRLNVAVAQDIQSFFNGKNICQTIISRSVRLAEAPSANQPIIEYDTKSIGAKEYRALAKELLEKQ